MQQFCTATADATRLQKWYENNFFKLIISDTFILSRIFSCSLALLYSMHRPYVIKLIPPV